MTVQRFRPRPIEIEAVQFDGDNREELYFFVGRSGVIFPAETRPDILVWTREGYKRVAPGDWIVKDGKSFYPYEPGIFEAKFYPSGGPRIVLAAAAGAPA